jgi:vitamin B12 transporter
MNVFTLRVAAPTVLFAIAAAPASAQNNENAQGSDIVVTAIGADQSLRSTGQAITVVGRDTIDRLQAASVADLLVTTPGITVTRNGGQGGFSAIRIRGAEGEHTLTLIDGVRVNDPSAPGGGFDFGNLLTGTIQRVEILRGPNSVPWGSQAIGGVVNVITAAPTRELSGSARAEWGSQDQLALSGNLGTTVGKLTAALGAGYFRDEGISSFKDGREADGYRQYAVSGKLGLALSANLDFDLRANFANSRANIDGFPPPAFSFADTPEFSRSAETYLYAGANLRLFDGSLKNRIAFTLADVNRDNFDGVTAAPSFLARGRSERFEYQGDATFSQALRAVFGLAHERSRFSDGFSPTNTDVTSGYLQLVADPTEQLTFTGGARWDNHATYGSQATFSANLAWRPNADTVVRMAYGEGFKAPTLFQLYSFFGNTTLKPERARSYEVGVEHRAMADSLIFGATLFQRDTRNQIDFISCFNRTTGICTNRQFGTYDNINRSRARGIEAFVRARPTGSVQVEANYSLIDAKNRTTGLALLRRPQHSVNLALDWSATSALNLGASVRWVSSSADVDFQTFARTRLAGYTLASLRAAYAVSERIELFGRIENLFDERYETVSGYGTYRRNANVGLRTRF